MPHIIRFEHEVLSKAYPKQTIPIFRRGASATGRPPGAGTCWRTTTSKLASRSAYSATNCCKSSPSGNRRRPTRSSSPISRSSNASALAASPACSSPGSKPRECSTRWSSWRRRGFSKAGRNVWSAINATSWSISKAHTSSTYSSHFRPNTSWL